MIKIKQVSKIILFLVLFILSESLLYNVYAESGVEDKADSNVSLSSSEEKKEELRKIEERHQDTQEAIKKKEAEAAKVTEEAEKVIEEKNIIKKESQVKEQAASVVKEELEVIKKEAEITNNPELLKKARDLSKESEQLDKEAQVSKEKLAVAESKAMAAQETISAHQAQIDSLKKALTDIKREKASKRSFIEKSIMAAAIIFIGLLLFLLLKLGLKRFEHLITHKDAIRENEVTLRMMTLINLFRWLGSIVIIGIIVYMVLENFGLNMAPLLAGAGIVGLAFGFGGQYLIRDLINGLFILIEGQYRVNDVVKINDYGGLVEDINLRITTLRDLEGRVIIVPNGEIKTVINYTKEYAHALFDIGVAYKENVDRVMDVIKEVGSKIREDKYFGKLILDDLEMFGVDDFGDSQVTIKFRIKTLPIKQWEIAREFRRRLKNRFDELGIEIPFPHRTLYWGIGKDNEWVKNLAEQAFRKEAK
ncbi:MAG: mechanosensitive ion channel domain-containing protein [Candidatus Omnitrophota bacterium]